MIEGAFSVSLETAAILPLRDPSGQTREIKAVADTGLNGYLTLPLMLLEDLELPVVGNGEASIRVRSPEYRPSMPLQIRGPWTVVRIIGANWKNQSLVLGQGFLHAFPHS